MTNMNKPVAGRAAASERVTLKTIADATGLSLSTVSLSLRGGTTLKADTRDKVLQAAQSLGYVPDRAGVRLRTGKTNVIVLVLDATEDSIDFARQMIQGIGHAMQGSRYHLTVAPEFEPVQSVDTVRYIAGNRTADGVIITHTTLRDPRVQLMMEMDYPFVTHGRTEFFTPHPYHDFRSEAFAVNAVERLVSQGCHRLSLVIGMDRLTNYHMIVSAFEQTVARTGVQGRVIEGSVAQGRPAALRQLGIDMAQMPDRPDGLIVDSELRTIALIGGFLEGGLVLGRDIRIIYKQTTDVLPTLFPQLDSIKEDVFAAGVELTRLLLRRIEGDAAATLQTLSEPEPIWRA